MKFFIDTADVGDIRDLNETGMVDGVTTNPSLIAKSGGKELALTLEDRGYTWIGEQPTQPVGG